MATWRGWEYVEAAPAGPNEQYAPDASQITRTLYFPIRPTVAQRQQIGRDWIGYAQRKVSLSGKVYISRTTPHFYPARDLAQGPHLYCQSLASSEMVCADDVESSALHADGDLTAVSDWWKTTWVYRTLPYDVKADDDPAIPALAGELLFHPDEGDALRRGWANTRYIVKLPEHGGRVIPIRQGVFIFVGVLDTAFHTVPTMEPFPFNETLVQVHYQWFGVPLDAYPFSYVQTALNTVNDATFDNYTTGTLLLLDAREVPRRDAFGQRTLDVTFKMLWAPRANADGACLGHNAILRIKPDVGPRWTLISTDGSAALDRRPYRYTDFSKLFHPVQT
jgi:hypothetical protein